MCVLLITRLLRLVGRLGSRKPPVKHASWVAIVTQTDRPKSVRNRFVIEVVGGVFVLPSKLITQTERACKENKCTRMSHFHEYLPDDRTYVIKTRMPV